MGGLTRFSGLTMLQRNTGPRSPWGSGRAVRSGWWFKRRSPAWAIIMRPMQTSLHHIKFTPVGLRALGNIVQRHLSSSAAARSASAWFTTGHADLDCPALNHNSIPAPAHPGHTGYAEYPHAPVGQEMKSSWFPLTLLKPPTGLESWRGIM